MADMETNIAYGVHGNTPSVENNTYELVEKTPAPEKGYSKNQMEIKKEKKEFCFKIFITTIAVTALLLVLIFLTFFLVHYITYQSFETQQSEVIESLQLPSLRLQLNKTATLQESLRSDFIEEQQTNELLTQNHIQGIEQKLNNLFVHSCKDLPQGSPSGYYYIVTNSSEVIRVYCDTSTRNCSCTTLGGWMNVANLDMTDPTQQCPDGFKLINRTAPPLRTCGRPDGVSGCVSTTFKAHGIEYSRVCGRIVGYQIGSPSGFRYQYVGINSHYVSGISLTHGQPRQHIYTFANAQSERYTSEVCPCIQGGTKVVPQFVGSDYFCDSAVGMLGADEGVFYSYDPLWDGQGCGSTSTCCEFNNPPWFCKQLPQPTTDDIEMRICENNVPSRDESPFEVVELFTS